MAESHHIVQLWPALRARPRLLGAIAFGIAVYAVARLFGDAQPAACALVGWNAGALLFLALAWHTTRGADSGAIRQRAEAQDEGKVAILALVVFSAVAIVLAVGTQLAQAKQLDEAERLWHLLLAVVTVFTSWLFTQVLFALHYAHDFYLVRLRGGSDPLQFPGTPDPTYGDFFHFACVIGTSAQTADITFMGSAMRTVGTVHCIVAFFFNASLIALSINVAASSLV
ncbi:MAG: putative transrane protein [Ramlibacter sp.]|nr:putative transrane protein [Ramlibacter sp.]